MARWMTSPRAARPERLPCVRVPGRSPSGLASIYGTLKVTIGHLYSPSWTLSSHMTGETTSPFSSPRRARLVFLEPPNRTSDRPGLRNQGHPLSRVYGARPFGSASVGMAFLCEISHPDYTT